MKNLSTLFDQLANNGFENRINQTRNSPSKSKVRNEVFIMSTFLFFFFQLFY